MKFFLDENIPHSVRIILEKHGFETDDVYRANLRGAKDMIIASYAEKHHAILVTKDLEFGSFHMYPKGTHYGLLIIRLPYTFTSRKIAETIDWFLSKIKPTILIGAMTILELGKYRTRRLSNGI